MLSVLSNGICILFSVQEKRGGTYDTSFCKRFSKNQKLATKDINESELSDVVGPVHTSWAILAY